MDLEPGVYEISIRYQSEGMLQTYKFDAENTDFRLWRGNFYQELTSKRQVYTAIIWNGKHLRNFEVECNYNGDGYILLGEVEVVEKRGWVLALGMGCLLLFGCADLLAMYYIILVSSFCLLRMYQEGGTESGKADGLFFLTGIVTSYFDFLTYPLSGVGILLVLYLNLYSRETIGRQVRSCIRKMALWCTGYAGMWCGKWLAGTLLLRENFFWNAWEQGKFRISVEDYTRFDVLAKNMQVLIKWPFILPCLVLVLYYALKL